MTTAADRALRVFTWIVYLVHDASGYKLSPQVLNRRPNPVRDAGSAPLRAFGFLYVSTHPIQSTTAQQVHWRPEGGMFETGKFYIRSRVQIRAVEDVPELLCGSSLHALEALLGRNPRLKLVRYRQRGYLEFEPDFDRLVD